MLRSLHNALSRPLNQFDHAGDASDPFDLAAAHAYGLACNHAFNDANERMAWGCCVLFLKANETSPAIPAADAVGQMLRLVQGKLGQAGFAAWLSAHQCH